MKIITKCPICGNEFSFYDGAKPGCGHISSCGNCGFETMERDEKGMMVDASMRKKIIEGQIIDLRNKLNKLEKNPVLNYGK
jgi:hypothetical protein